MKGLHSTISNKQKISKVDMIKRVNELLEQDVINERDVLEVIFSYKRIDCYRLLNNKTKLEYGWTNDQLITHACNIFNLNELTFYTKNRQREYVNAKKAIAYILRKRQNTLEYIGNLFGGLNHATILHYTKMVQNAIDIKDTVITDLVDRLDNDIAIADSQLKVAN